MLRRPNVFALILVLSLTCASAVLLSAQAVPSQNEDSIQGSSSNVAFVYVSSMTNYNKYLIQAYTASANGTLVATVGLVFSPPISYLAVNAHYLFATDGVDIDSFSIASDDGAITQVDSVNARSLGGGCGGPIDVFLDRTGTTLYDLDYLGGDCANNAYQEFTVKANGSLDYLGAAGASPGYVTPLNFIGNNQYAYSATCYHFGPQVFGYERASDGTLTELNIVPAMPPGAPGQEYCPSLGAADSSNHLAVVMSPIYDSTWGTAGPSQLGVYTANGSGFLATTSTYANMPQVEGGSVNEISISPSGELLAVAGSAGLQVFHFNGAGPVTRYTGLLTTNAVTQVAWDNSNHLYAISPSSGALYVFEVTPESFEQATGSPYAVTNALDLAVLPQ